MSAPLSSLYRTAFVTGASTGLGQAFARMLLDEGVQVWATSRRPERMEKQNGLTPVALDLHAPVDVIERTFADAETAAGGFDLVINNAGYGIYGGFVETDFSLWRAQIDAMLGSTAALARLGLRGLLARGRGALVNVSSLAAEFPLPYMSGYNVVKAGLSALSESLMVETAGTGVIVIDFRPGDYRTRFNDAMQTGAAPMGREKTWARIRTMLEKNLATSPDCSRAATDLRGALQRRRSGVVRSGGFFQAVLAPLLARLGSQHTKRAIQARYFGSN